MTAQRLFDVFVLGMGDVVGLGRSVPRPVRTRKSISTERYFGTVGVLLRDATEQVAGNTLEEKDLAAHGARQ